MTQPQPTPGDMGLPIIGHIFSQLKDPIKWGSEMRDKYGSVYHYRGVFGKNINFTSPEGLEFLFADRGKNFSCAEGYKPLFGPLAPAGYKNILLLGRDEHQKRRKIIGQAFKTPALTQYLEKLNILIRNTLEEWGEKEEIDFYPEMKKLALGISTNVFLDLQDKAEIDKVNNALQDYLAASVGLVRAAVPGTKMGRGVKGQRYVKDFLSNLVPERRVGTGTDMFTKLCQVEDDDGTRLTRDEVAAETTILWNASHDTLTSSSTSLMYELCKNPMWQSRLRAEVEACDFPEEGVNFPRLGELSLCEGAFKEALRLRPPVWSAPRVAKHDVEFDGYLIPKGTLVWASISAVHMDHKIWPNPDKFDPLRFSDESQMAHRYAWAPFGGGMHTCIGLQFAIMEIKSFLTHLLKNYEFSIPEGYVPEFSFLPSPKPKDGLPIRLRRINRGHPKYSPGTDFVEAAQ